ncbi:MAG: hypothetical protein IKX62_00825 [Bacteroidales bacterium]|nr:hypothetical protein [Bacteroidales bacterium]
MEYNFDDWKKALEDFQSSVSKDLEEIRQHKEEVRQMKSEIFSAMGGGYYLRDEHRVVISAPEIILGNVDRDGVLMGDGSSVVILRGQSVALEGVGESGSVHTRAASIRQTAVDPGIDGLESVVGSLSEVVSQARQVVLAANDSSGVFSQTPASAGEGSVSIHADRQLVVDASASAEGLSASLDEQVKQLETLKSTVETEVKDGIKAFGSSAKAIQDLFEKNEKMTSDVMELRSNVGALSDMSDLMESLAPALYQGYASATSALSRLAELNRQITCLKAEKDAIKGGDDFKQKPTGAAVSIVGERVDIVSHDGDGNLRDNPEAGVGILANNIEIRSLDAEGALQPEGKVLVNAQTVEVSTVNSKELKYNDKGELESGQYPAEGDVLVRSKTVTLESVDSELKDGKLEEKALTKDSAFTIRTEKVDVSATDTEGKATGSIALNAKDLSVRSMDVDKEKRTDDKLAADSSMLLLAEKMFLGAKKKDIKSKKLQAVSEELGLFADKTFEAQQDEGKAALQLAGGNAAVGGSKTEVFGATTINGKTEVKDELKAPKATIDNLEAKSSFKSSNISDGIAVPGAGGGGSLSAKLKAEDAPEKKE